MAEVTDGTSQTLFVGERGIVCDGTNTTGWWTWGPTTTIAPTQALRPGSYETPASIVHWWSYHPDGAHFLLVDGSIRFLSYGIDADIFTGLGSRDGVEIVSHAR